MDEYRSIKAKHVLPSYIPGCAVYGGPSTFKVLVLRVFSPQKALQEKVEDLIEEVRLFEDCDTFNVDGVVADDGLL